MKVGFKSLRAISLGRLSELPMGESQQESKAVAIGCHGARRDVLLLHQPLHEEALEQDWKALRDSDAHDAPFAARAKRSAAMASSSGVAVTYQ